MNMQVKTGKHTCAEIPEFERLNYFYGQMLGAADFRGEQSFMREKLKLHNRCLHGYGVICGLEVTPVHEPSCCPPADKEDNDRIKAELAKVEDAIKEIQHTLQVAKLTPEKQKELQGELEKLMVRREELKRALEDRPKDKSCDEPKFHNKVAVQCGFALDCCGNELVLRQPVIVDLWSALKHSDQRRLKEEGKGTIYLSICYCAEPTHPSRPVMPDSCGAMSDCNYGKLRDSVRFRVGLDRPHDDERCEPCCAPCTDECLLLAKIDWDGSPGIDEDEIDNSVRRPISLYPPTVITGVSWVHGGTYSSGDAKGVIGTVTDSGQTDGIEVTFSRPVYAETLTPGVVDLWRIQGGRGLRGVISAIEGDYVNKPASGLITSFKYRDESGETLNDGDRILIIIRADFILDSCCRAVDGNNIGGRIPQLEAYRKAAKDKPDDEKDDGKTPDKNGGGKQGPCVLPPGGIGPWTSGNGSAGGTFESWFYVD